MTDTIFALSSGVGKAGVAVIRISGPKARKALQALTYKPLPEPRKACFTRLYDEDDVIDEALVLWFRAPHSFTGEDIVELQVHGSVAVVQKLLQLLLQMPECRMAEPGEFSKRAFMQGKMDLTQAEGLADLIEAETEVQHRQAIRHMQGEQGRLYDAWRQAIITLQAHVEAYIDFPDEDLPENLRENFIQETRELAEHIQNHLKDDRGERVREGATMVILGAPNSGKSTLFNYLAKRDAAIISDIAGTTRDTLDVHLNIGGYPVRLVDTAGLRETEDRIEEEGIARALKQAEHADIILFLYELGKADKYEFSNGNSYKRADIFHVATKLDQQPAADISPFDAAISVISGEGMEQLHELITQSMEHAVGNIESPVVTRERHRYLLKQCVNCLSRFQAEISQGRPIELCGETIRLAAQSLAEITGKITLDDVLDVLFGEFCIGK